MATVPTPLKLSLETVTQLFRLKIGPTASYGIRLAWNDMTANQLERIDTVKATFLKRALGLPRNARNRLVYALAGTEPFIEDLVTQFNLSTTPALEKFRRDFSIKMREIPMEFYTSQAMTDDSWKGPLETQRQLITRLAVHG